MRAKIGVIIASRPRGAVSVAALNTATGAQFAAGARAGMWTASAYKLLVLTALLLQNGGELTPDQVSVAARAIENSDNAAGYSLFLSAGGTSGLDRALDTLRMTHTVPGRSDPTFTTTSAVDYVRLLTALTAKGPLSRSARSRALSLMRNVEADQRWGVGAVADNGTRFANKNGWLSIEDSNGAGDADAGRWAVASVGVLTVHHQQVLMAVFTQHQRDFGSGVALVTRLARTMVPAVSS